MCRFASKRRFVCTFEWLTADPNAAVFPQIAQARGISGISSAGGIEVNGTVARIATQCDGTTLLRVLEAAADRLERAVDEVNALNVYPVPDGDTGTNMVHTVHSALKRARGRADPRRRERGGRPRSAHGRARQQRRDPLADHPRSEGRSRERR